MDLQSVKRRHQVGVLDGLVGSRIHVGIMDVRGGGRRSHDKGRGTMAIKGRVLHDDAVFIMGPSPVLPQGF